MLGGSGCGPSELSTWCAAIEVYASTVSACGADLVPCRRIARGNDERSFLVTMQECPDERRSNAAGFRHFPSP